MLLLHFLENLCLFVIFAHKKKFLKSVKICSIRKIRVLFCPPLNAYLGQRTPGIYHFLAEVRRA
ncbi:MAG: hypothetical protein B5M51_06855 [Anaerolinea sp. 4484_236]|nr:MAG: hypothetical protein B5M51_06855 [Anaerolinea sp. 4484_236]